MPQFQIIIVGIFCAAVFSCWLVFGGSTFNVGVTAVIAIVFLLVALALLFWVFFTPDGKAFASNYNKLQQHKVEAERKITSTAETLLRESNYVQLMLEFKKLSTFADVSEWDKLAELEIKKIVDAIQSLETEFAIQAKVIDRLKINELKTKYIVVLENMADKLQEAIDFTPNSSKEQKVLLKELRQKKKELQLEKREVATNMRAIQASARSRSAYAGRGFLGIYNSKLATHERRIIRYQKEAALRPSEDSKAAIERQILQIDRDILWVERFTE